MLVRYYAVKDVVAGNFMNPVAMPNDMTAKRSLKLAANDPQAFNGQKEDIQLWYLFSCDSSTGIISENEPYLIGNLIDFIEVKKEEN